VGSIETIKAKNLVRGITEYNYPKN
jgi:hypothetical protein